MEAAELPPLSGRILERIFQHLSAFQLARARLTCRQWNEVITGSPQLVAKFRLSLERFFCGGETERDFMLENVKTCYSTADYGASHLIQLEHVWVTVGPNIRHLIIHDCWLDLSKVGYLLRYLPNLEELTFTPYYLESDMIKDVKIDYRMDKLATLIIGSTDRIDEPLLEHLDIQSAQLRSNEVLQCPLLETVHLESTYYVCDRDVQLLCKTLKRLRSLSLVDCRLVSDVTVENVIVHCLKLEYLRIEYCRKVEKNRRWYQTEMKPRFKISIGPECWYKDS
ncbi:hypothetical protein quinque_010431 [Culex quinquefasciatus]